MGSIQNNPNTGIKPIGPQLQPLGPLETPEIAVTGPPKQVAPKSPSSEILRSQQLTNSSLLDNSVDQSPPPDQIEETQHRLQRLDLNINQQLSQHLTLVPTQTGNSQAPRVLNSKQVHDLLVTGLGDSIHLEHFQFASQNLESSLKSSKLSEQGIQVLESTLEEQLQKLSKKEQHYNSPLYKLADKLGLKNRKLKLQGVQQQKQHIQNLHQQQISLHQLNGQSASQELNHYSELLNQSIQQFREEGQNLLKGLKDNQPLLWNLSLQSKSQLQNTMARVTLEKLLGKDQMGELVESLEKEHQQNDNLFSEVVAKSNLMENRISRFKEMTSVMKREEPEQYEVIASEMRANMNSYFAEEILPLIKQLPPEVQQNMLDQNDPLNSNVTQNIVNMKAPPGLAPSLYNILPDEQKALVDQLVEGMQSEMPNRLLDDNSLTLNGTTYANRTFLAQAGMAQIFNYTSEDGKKIVVKQPIQPKDMSESDFEQVVLKESVHELNVHYLAMGQDQQGDENMVKLLGTIPTDKGPLIALEFIDGGNTLEFTREKMPLALETQRITQDEQQTIHKHLLYQMMQGMEHFQSQGLSHLDIKPDNFFIQKDGTVKLADFGMSQTVSQFEATRQNRGDAAWYQPPEMSLNILDFNSKFNLDHVVSNKVDTWAVGVMAFRMLKGEFPFDHKSLSKIETLIKDFGDDFSNRVIPDPQTPEDHLLNSMLHPDPSQRPSFSQLMQNPVFDSLFENGQRGQFKNEVRELTQRVFES